MPLKRLTFTTGRTNNHNHRICDSVAMLGSGGLKWRSSTNLRYESGFGCSWLLLTWSPVDLVTVRSSSAVRFFFVVPLNSPTPPTFNGHLRRCRSEPCLHFFTFSFGNLNTFWTCCSLLLLVADCMFWTTQSQTRTRTDEQKQLNFYISKPD